MRLFTILFDIFLGTLLLGTVAGDFYFKTLTWLTMAAAVAGVYFVANAALMVRESWQKR